MQRVEDLRLMEPFSRDVALAQRGHAEVNEHARVSFRAAQATRGL